MDTISEYGMFTYRHMLPRSATPRLLRLIEHFPVVVVAGARQVGKTTLLHALFGATWPIVTLDPAEDIGQARADPDLFLASHPGPLIVDEIQYAPELVAAIKRSVDRDRRPGRFLLTGSQQWSVMRALAESLAGRAVFLDLSGFTLQERAGAGTATPWLHAWLASPSEGTLRELTRLDLGRGLNELLYRGTLPEAWSLPLDLLPDFFLGYRRTYLERDLRQLADIQDVQLFSRFIGLAAALSAQEINASQLGRELNVSPPTARRWLGLLEGSFQWFEVPPWSTNVVKRASGRSRGYLADSGFACAVQVLGSPAALDVYPRRGALFKAAVVAELRTQAALLSPRPNLWHWRLHSGAEVDLLLEWNGTVYPFEIKLHSNPGRDAVRGIEAFRSAHPGLRVAPGLVIAPCAGVTALTPTDWAVPWDAALRSGTLSGVAPERGGGEAAKG